MTEKEAKLKIVWHVVWALAAAILGGMVTYRITDDLWKADAVKHGYARWVVTNEFGATKWEWIEKKP